MALLQGRSVRLVATGMAVPDKVMDNDELARIVDTSNEWIVERTGIRERRIASKDENASDLAIAACRQAIDRSGVDVESIDMVVVATNSPDTLFPSVAARVQGAIGASKAGAFDVQSGCTGSVYSLSVASSGIASGLWNRVMVCGVEVLSRLIDWEDRTTCVLFGDGAGAVVLEAGEKGSPGVIACDMKADGTKWDYITLPGGLSSLPANSDTLAEKKHFVSMKGNDVFKFTQRVLPGYLKDVCSDAGISPSDIDRWIFHQANLRIMEGVLKRLGVSEDRAINNLERYGNTSAASVFLALNEAYEGGRITYNSGQKVLITSFGAGMTYGAFIYEA